MSLSEAKKRFIDLNDIRLGEVNPKEQIAEQKQQDQSTVVYWQVSLMPQVGNTFKR